MVVRHNIIPRDNVITGAANDSYHPDGSFHCAVDQPAVATITISPAQILTLNAMPVQLLAQFPSGRRIIPLAVYYRSRASAWANGGDVQIRYEGGGITFAEIDGAEIRSVNPQIGWGTRTALLGTPQQQVLPDAGVEVWVGTDFTGSGGELLLDLVYLEV